MFEGGDELRVGGTGNPEAVNRIRGMRVVAVDVDVDVRIICMMMVNEGEVIIIYRALIVIGVVGECGSVIVVVVRIVAHVVTVVAAGVIVEGSPRRRLMRLLLKRVERRHSLNLTFP